MVFKYLQWGFYRIFFYLMVLGAMFSLGLLPHLLAPVYSYYLFGNLQISRNRRLFFPFTFFVWKTIFRWLKDRDYRSMFVLPLFAPPQGSPDPALVRLAPSWSSGEFDCHNCVKCCLQLGCPLLDRQSCLCHSYQTLHWCYFNCGRYPLSEKQLVYYGCPKWELR